MATGDAVNPTQAPPSVPAPINRLCSILLLSVLLALTAPSGSGAVSGTVFKSASQFATPPSDVAGKNTSTKPPHVRKHLEPAISVPEGTTLEDCRKHPGLCQPAACELWRDDIKDRYVRDKDACGSDDHLIHYLELFYCVAGGRLKLLIASLFVVWMLLLFYGMSIVAEVFLCPAVEYISELLHLSPDIAGVTLLAFASGAPDIFTELAAIDGGQAVEVELAVASVVGSGLFICSISLAAVIFVRPVEIKDRVAFVRDVTAYFVTCAVTLRLLWDAQFSAKEAALLIVMYVAYILLCIYTSRGSTTIVHRHVHGHHVLPLNSPRFCGASDGSTSKIRERGVELLRWSAPAAVSVAAVAGSAARITSSSRGGSGSVVNGASPVWSSKRSESGSWVGGMYEDSSHSRSGEENSGSCSHTPGRTVPWLGSGMAPRQSVASEMGAEDWDLLEAPDTPPRQLLWVLTAPASVWGAVCAAARERIHFRDNVVMNACVIVTSPLVLLMHATMPALDDGCCSRRHCAVLALLAPLFLLSVVGAPSLGALPFLALCMLLSSLLYGVMYATFQRNLEQGEVLFAKANTIFAVIAFVQSVVWLSQIADEVVALFQAIGNIFSVADDLLGATVLAWGETVPDVMAMIAVSRAGQSTMAVAACFGGPVLNLLIGTGVPVLVKNAKLGTLPFRLSNGIIILFICSMALLLALLIIVPLSGWRLSKRSAWALIAVYLSFQVLFLMAEEDLLFTTPFNHKALGNR